MRRYVDESADQIMHRHKLENLREHIARIDAGIDSKSWAAKSPRQQSAQRETRGALVRELMGLVRERTGKTYTPAQERAIVDGESNG